ncbi:MAG: precorrin-2 C(20)-methyltransferase [Oscillospiraceae bacterium]
MKKGKLYGISVGPGDPELITVKAQKMIQSCGVIAVPTTKSGGELALDIAKGLMPLDDKKILRLPFLMTRDPKELEESHLAVAGKIEEELEQGNDVGMLNLGDISVFSTFSYIMEIVTAHGYEAVVIPGVTSFCASAARLGISLTSMNSPLHIIPAGGGSLEESLDMAGNKVLMKSGRAIPKVKEELRKRGLYEKSYAVQNCGLPNEKLCFTLDDMSDDPSYFSTIIVKEQ